MRKKISRKEAIQRMGLIGLSPVIPAALPGGRKPYSLRAGAFPAEGKEMGIDPFSPERMVLQPFEYGEAVLHNGFLNRQVEYIRDYYLNIPNDDLLKGFRKRAGLPTYGARDLGGWYTKDFFHNFGQILSGLSRLYAVSRDLSCKQKVSALMDGWAECIRPDGYFYYSERPNAHLYVFDKMVGGLVDANIFTGNRQALDHLSVITDWAIKNLDKDKPYALNGAFVSNSEWYTLPENLYRAYEVTRDKKYFDFAQYWEYAEYWDLLAKKKSIFEKKVRYHGYSHLNTLSSAAMAYLLKGDSHYLDTLKNGYDFFQQEECFATGGYGPAEALLPKRELIEALRDTHYSFETQCGTWAAFKLCRYLLLFTGDARYGDWIERLIYNGAGASIPLSPDGRIFYYSDYNPRGGVKRNFMEGWSCCNGTRPQVAAEYSHLIYFKNSDGILVNLYAPSQVKWKNVVLTQQTRFPEDNSITFKVNSSSGGPVRFTLYFRNPGWLKGKPKLSINGEETASSDLTITRNWIVYSKDWYDMDEVKLEFPMELGLSRLGTEKKYPAAITYGPVVLAIRPGAEYPSDFLGREHPFQDFEPVEGEPLTWRVKHSDDILIRPFYAYKEGETYILYFDPTGKDKKH